MDKALKQVPWGKFALVYLYALIAASPLLLYLFEVRVLDRYLDVFYLGICLVGGIILPNKRVYLLSLILAVYVAFGFILSEGFSFNVFVYEVKLFVFLYLYFIWKDYKVEFDSEDLKKFILVVLFSTVIFFVLFPERRLNLINESNYFCMLFGVIGFSLLETVKDEKYVVRYRVVFFLLSLFVIVLAQSRTGLAFLGGCWAIYLYRVYGVVTFFYAFSIAILLIFLGMPFISELELFSRLSALSDVSSVDRFIFLDSYLYIVDVKGISEIIFPMQFMGYYDIIVPTMDWWVDRWGVRNDMLLSDINLAPFHFHSAFLRILGAHGIFALIAYLVFIAYVARVNIYMAAALFLGSFSMSVPYLSLMYPVIFFVAVKGRIDD